MKQTPAAGQAGSEPAGPPSYTDSARVSAADSAIPNAPFHEIAFREGRLFHASPALPETEILDTPPIEIVAKAQAIDLPGEDVAFLFRLNHLSDELWVRHFTAHLEGVKAEIQGAQLELRCAPSVLKPSYATVKSAIAQANESYTTYRTQLCERVSKRDAQQAEESAAAGQKATTARGAWEQLEL